jgi:cell cycle checkpoint control protein RAD9A
MVKSTILTCRIFTETNMRKPSSGIVKTHRLTLQTPSSQLHLHVPEAWNESHVVIGPKAMRDMIDHFPSTRGKADPQLAWVFDDTEVHVRSLENSLNNNGTRSNVSPTSIYLKNT